MRQNYLKGAASFMIALILTLPIYSSLALAVLSNGYIYGQDNIRGYYRRNENIYLSVTAWVSGDDEITPSQVHLYDSHGPIFNYCTEKGGSFDCTYQMFSDSITENPYQVRVALYDDNDIFNSMLILHGAFDEIPPEISSFSITPQIIGSGDINFNYNVYDHSYSPTDSNRCSGIRKIELSTNGAVFKTAEINSTFNQCSASGTITVPVSEINTTEGIIEVVLTAYDNFNQESAAASQFTYDPNPPVIDTDSLEIVDNNENSIDYIRDTPINGIIRFTVLSEDLDINNAYGDISEINIDNIPSYNNKQASCIQFEEGYRCSFDNIQVKLSQSTTIHITVNVKDLAGNTESAVLTKGITHDATGPSVTGIKTNKVDNDISYAGTSTTFIAELNEDGIGINKEDIKLDLSNVKTGLANKVADECTNSGNQWTCYWYNINTDKSDGEKTVSLSGTDKLGNEATGTLSSIVVIDRTAPSITFSQVTASGVGVEAIPGYTKTNDVLDVMLNIKEKNKLRAYADFSSFVTTQDNIAGSCVKEDEENWKCEWSSDPIDVPGHIIGDIVFNITDFSGNSLEHKESVEVMEYEDAVNVSYWTSTVSCSPNLVDRQVTSLVSTRVYCSITLNPITADQEILSINLDSCEDKLENSMGYIESIQLLNAERGSTEPYFSINLIKGELSINQLSITCPLQIISRVGTKINQNPEIEQVDININFYNMPLGEYGKGIEKKIKDAKDDAFKGIWKTIGFLKKIVSWAKLICNALSALHKVKLIFKVFTEEVTTAHIAMIGTPVEPILAAEKTQACLNDKTLGELSKESYMFLNGPCKFVNCQLSPPEQTNPKTTKGTGGFWDIAKSIGKGHWLDTWIDENVMTSQSWNTLGTSRLLGGKGATGTFEEVFGKRYYQYANSRDNLLVAIVTGCIPGIINGLNKYRQILCLYADCLEQNANNNVPVKICEDQKSYATCKYITGEIFAVLPWTAFFDYYMGMIRGALSDPISAIAAAYNILLNRCVPICTPDEAASIQWRENELECRALQFLSLLGEVINDVYGIIDDYHQIKNDYCERIDEDDDDDDED